MRSVLGEPALGSAWRDTPARSALRGILWVSIPAWFLVSAGQAGRETERLEVVGDLTRTVQCEPRTGPQILQIALAVLGCVLIAVLLTRRPERPLPWCTAIVLVLGVWALAAFAWGQADAQVCEMR